MAGCSLPQGPHTAVLEQRQVTDPDASDLQAFMSRRVLSPIMSAPVRQASRGSAALSHDDYCACSVPLS